MNTESLDDVAGLFSLIFADLVVTHKCLEYDKQWFFLLKRKLLHVKLSLVVSISRFFLRHSSVGENAISATVICSKFVNLNFYTVSQQMEISILIDSDMTSYMYACISIGHGDFRRFWENYLTTSRSSVTNTDSLEAYVWSLLSILLFAAISTFQNKTKSRQTRNSRLRMLNTLPFIQLERLELNKAYDVSTYDWWYQAYVNSSLLQTCRFTAISTTVDIITRLMSCLWLVINSILVTLSLFGKLLLPSERGLKS